MQVLDLFSGIGGFSLAGHWAGMTTAAFCEIDPFCQKVLQKNFPGIPIYDEVRTVTKQQLEKDGVIDDTRGIDLITGGIPCQPFSIAGKQEGKKDERYLWPEMFRIVRELQPSWILVENVTGFIDLALDDVLDDLESEGYATQSLILPAQAVGAPHKRERVWVVGYAKRSGFLRESWRRSREVVEDGYLQLEKGNVAHTDGTRQQEFNATTITEEKRFHTRGDIKRRTNWIIKSRLGRDSHGIPRKLDEHRWPRGLGQSQYDWEPPRIAAGVKHRKERLKTLGNSIVPQVAYQILKAIVETE